MPFKAKIETIRSRWYRWKIPCLHLCQYRKARVTLESLLANRGAILVVQTMQCWLVPNLLLTLPWAGSRLRIKQGTGKYLATCRRQSWARLSWRSALQKVAPAFQYALCSPGSHWPQQPAWQQRLLWTSPRLAATACDKEIIASILAANSSNWGSTAGNAPDQRISNKSINRDVKPSSPSPSPIHRSKNNSQWFPQ